MLLTLITAASYIYCYSISETRISRVRFFIRVCGIFDPFTFRPVNEGDRIAQLIIERIYTPEISVVDVSQLPSCYEPVNDPSVGLGGDYTW